MDKKGKSQFVGSELCGQRNTISNDLKKAVESFEEKERKQDQLHLFDDSEEQDEKGVSV